MIYLTEVMAAFLTAFALENLLFTRAVDIPGLYEKRSLRQLLTVGAVHRTENRFSAADQPLYPGDAAD